MRTFDPSLHNYIANHPAVAPYLAHDPALGPLFFDNLVLEPQFYALLHNGRDAAMIFEWSSPHVWQQHTMFLKSCRGKQAVVEAKKMLRHMFEVEGAVMIWGQTPLDNRAARMFNRWCGGKSVGFGDHHVVGPVEYFSRDRAEWLAENSAG
jgi:hypothetical protein